MNTAPPTRRLTSLDALRGFDMMWIVGGDGLAAALGRMSHWWPAKVAGDQLEHVPWAGFHFYDLIFPLFVFIVGVSIVFSLTKEVEQSGKAGAIRRVLRRFVLLYALALIYSGGVSNSWPDIRLLGVLNRIALCYLGAALLFLYLPSPRALGAICAGLLIGYWALMTFVPFPDVRPVDAEGRVINPVLSATRVEELNFSSPTRLRGMFEPGLNFAHYIDQKYLPGKKWDKTWDPEGLLSTLPAIATCLLGVLAGLFLRNSHVGDLGKVGWLIALGCAGIVSGYLWGLQFPVVKKIWSSSFVLVAGGYSAILLGVFFWVVDMRGYQKWCQPLIWVGMNSITVYMADNLIGFRRVATRFLGGDVHAWIESRLTTGLGDLILSLGELSLAFLLAWFLYRRKIFLRV